MGSNGLAFKHWAARDNVTNTASLDQFKGMRLGIDADDYLQSLLVTGNREPLLPAHGGYPFTLDSRVNQDLQNFKDAEITPFFVFSGLDLACKDRASILNETRRVSGMINDAWAIYDNADGVKAVDAFGKASTYNSYHIARSLHMYLHSQNVRTQVAPYSAAAQLAYLQGENVVDCVQSSASGLVTGLDRVILSFDWETNQVVFVTLQKCLTKLELTKQQFINVCLLSGSSILPAFPEMEADNTTSKIHPAKSLLKSVGYDVDLLCRHKEADYHELFYKAKFALKHPVLLTQGGRVEMLNWKSGPGDAHEFIGQRLPDELYLYLSRGLIGPRLLNWRTRREVLETPPLDGGVSPTYRDLVQSRLRPLRTQSLALMSHALHRYYQNSDVDIVCWFDEGNKAPLNIPQQNEPAKAADLWHVKSAHRPRAGDDSRDSSIIYAIMSLSDDSEAKTTVTARPSGPGPHIYDAEEVRTNTVWRFLQDRGYINADHTLSPWGKVLQAAFEQAIKSPDMSDTARRTEMEEAILLTIELLRLDLVGTHEIFPVPPYTGAPIRGSATDKQNALLVSRIACLGNLQHREVGYTGPLSRNLLAYQQVVAAIRCALRDLLEVHACYMLLSGTVDRQWKASTYTDVAASLPFVNEPNLGMSLLVKSHLDELSCQSPTDLHIWFLHAEDIEGDLEKSWRMWDAINAGVQSADSTINSDVKGTFEKANNWLKTKLEHA